MTILDTWMDMRTVHVRRRISNKIFALVFSLWWTKHCSFQCGVVQISLEPNHLRKVQWKVTMTVHTNFVVVFYGKWEEVLKRLRINNYKNQREQNQKIIQQRALYKWRIEHARLLEDVNGNMDISEPSAATKIAFLLSRMYIAKFKKAPEYCKTFLPGFLS